jgi:hypothetical protein
MRYIMFFDESELQYFKTLGNNLLSLSKEQLEIAILQKVLFELEDFE